MPTVTVQAAFTQSFNALMDAAKAAGVTAKALAEGAGLDGSTLTRWSKGQRFPRIKELEQLRKALRVEPRELFDPDAALAKIGLSRLSDSGHSEVAHDLDDATGVHLGSGLPPALQGGPLVVHAPPDADLLALVIGNWHDMTPEARTELFLHSRRLKGPGSSPPASTAVGFKSR